MSIFDALLACVAKCVHLEVDKFFMLQRPPSVVEILDVRSAVRGRVYLQLRVYPLEHRGILEHVWNDHKSAQQT